MIQACSARSGFRFEIRFEPLFHPGRALAFRCGRQGHVELEDFSEHARADDLFAKATIGRAYGVPRIMERPHADAIDPACGGGQCRARGARAPATLHA